MPPKRAASAAGSSSSSSSKKAKTASEEPPRSKRWSAVSGSANADVDYKTTWENPDKWMIAIGGDGDDGCGRKNCVCNKPTDENPDHPWVVSQAGYRKFYTQHIHQTLRDPDNFDMYTFNDHAGYGALEVTQNLFLDFNEAAERGWREQWAVCEGMALWLTNPASGIMMMIDDGECVQATVRPVGRMFLYMLAQLDNQDLMGDATDVRNLGTVMAMYLTLAPSWRDSGCLEDDGRKGKKRFQADYFDDAILSYANHRGVTLRGPHDIDEIAASLNGEVELPKKGAADPWGWKAVR
ncbi:hypothetical protein F4779DRAFT_632525 [Xylariaceae sp. FL0662B]|nr:hypothetical protein F4779DRAFT_632525 [Xylariaceae sp. FL0662B]